MTITGGCLCGAVRYRIEGDPLLTAVCHCRNCQRQAGSAMSVLIGVGLRFASLQAHPGFGRASATPAACGRGEVGPPHPGSQPGSAITKPLNSNPGETMQLTSAQPCMARAACQ